MPPACNPSLTTNWPATKINTQQIKVVSKQEKVEGELHDQCFTPTKPQNWSPLPKSLMNNTSNKGKIVKIIIDNH